MTTTPLTVSHAQRWRWCLVSAVVMGAGLWAYQNSFWGPFLLDDEPAIQQNPHIRQLWPAWGATTARPPNEAFARPIVNLSLAINFALGGLTVFGYHVFNVLIHLLAALVLSGVVRRTLLSDRLRSRFGPASSWLSLAVALIWVVHPLLTESVDYVIQRAELLMALFYLLTLYGVMRGAQSAQGRAWYTMATICCFLGMGSKPVMVTAPLMVWLYDGLFLAGSFRAALRQRAGLYAGLTGSWVFLATLLMLAPHSATPSVGFSLKAFTWAEYARTQPGVLLHYLKLAFWPHPLCFDYQWPMAKTTSAILAPSLVIGALLFATGWTLRYQLALGFVGAWFFLTLAPTSSVIPIADAAAEHRMYLPLAAPIVLTVIGGWMILRRLVRQPQIRHWATAGLLMGIVTTLSGVTIRRNEDYRSELSMWNDVLWQRPDNVRAHTNLGVALMERGRFEEATAHYAAVLRLEPSNAHAQDNLGVAFLKQGKLHEAIHHFHEALRLQPNDATAYSSLGFAMAQQGNFAAAIPLLSRALKIVPHDAKVHNNLGAALGKQGRLEEAIAHFSQALTLEPTYADARKNLSLAFAQRQRQREEPQRLPFGVDAPQLGRKPLQEPAVPEEMGAR